MMHNDTTWLQGLFVALSDDKCLGLLIKWRIKSSTAFWFSSVFAVFDCKSKRFIISGKCLHSDTISSASFASCTWKLDFLGNMRSTTSIKIIPASNTVLISCRVILTFCTTIDCTYLRTFIFFLVVRLTEQRTSGWLRFRSCKRSVLLVKEET